MKIFEIVRRNYEILGITSAQSLQKYRLNIRINMALLLIGFITFLHTMQIIFVASTLTERMESATTTSGSVIISICFITIIFKMRTLFECIDFFEDMIAKSKQ